MSGYLSCDLPAQRVHCKDKIVDVLCMYGSCMSQAWFTTPHGISLVSCTTEGFSPYSLGPFRLLEELISGEQSQLGLMCLQAGLREKLGSGPVASEVRDAPFVQIPLGVTEDRLVGTVDIEASMKVTRAIFLELMCLPPFWHIQRAMKVMEAGH